MVKDLDLVCLLIDIFLKPYYSCTQYIFLSLFQKKTVVHNRFSLVHFRSGVILPKVSKFSKNILALLFVQNFNYVKDV